MKKKFIGWGCSKIYEVNAVDIKKDFIFFVDSSFKKKKYLGLDVYNDFKILKKFKKNLVVIFSVSNSALFEISKILNQLGLKYNKNYIYYSDYMENIFKKRLNKYKINFNKDLVDYSKSYSLISNKAIHSTIYGLYLYLYLINKTTNIEGNIAEVGSYECGTSLAAMHSMIFFKKKKFISIFDTFKGFPSVSSFDKKVGKGHFNIKINFSDLNLPLMMHKNFIKIYKGPVPQTFKRVPKKEKFSVVFHDLDLYVPTKKSLDFFWKRLSSGGYFIIHDYFYEKNGYKGVSKAVDDFINKNSSSNMKIMKFPECLSVVINKKK